MANRIIVNLDTSKSQYNIYECKQNDDLILEASIFENGIEKDVTTKAITINCTRSDGTYVVQNTGITRDKNKIIANLKRDFTRVDGLDKLEIVLLENEKQNTTFDFNILVKPSVLKTAVEESKDTVIILEELGNKIVEAGQVKAQTEELIATGGAATKGDIATVNSQLEQKANKTYYGELNILDYKQYKNGDDWGPAFNKAIDVLKNIGCGIILVPPGIYMCSTTIKLKRGVVLKGCGTWDSNASTIKLANGANTTLIKSPYAVEASPTNQTHYVCLENIVINGNRLNQTEENVLVDFRGLYVGSWIRDVMICDSKGVGLKTGSGQDLYIENLWVLSCDVTNGYACEFGSGGADGISVMTNIYVENTTNGSNPTSFVNRTDETVRGKGILINGYANLSIYGLHQEGHKVGVHIKGDCRSIIIDRFSSAHMGNSNESIENCQILMEVSPSYFHLRGVHAYNSSSNYYMLQTTTKTTINSSQPGGRISPIEGAINSFSTMGQNDLTKRNVLPENTEVPYQLKITRQPNVVYSWSGIEIDNGGATKTRLVGNSVEGKLCLNDTELIKFTTPNNDRRADSVSINGNLKLKQRTDTGYTDKGDLFLLNNLVYESLGNNNAYPLVFCKRGSVDPWGNITGEFEGQMYINYTNKKVYVCVKDNSTEWSQISN